MCRGEGCEEWSQGQFHQLHDLVGSGSSGGNLAEQAHLCFRFSNFGLINRLQGNLLDRVHICYPRVWSGLGS